MTHRYSVLYKAVLIFLSACAPLCITLDARDAAGERFNTIASSKGQVARRIPMLAAAVNPVTAFFGDRLLISDGNGDNGHQFFNPTTEAFESKVEKSIYAHPVCALPSGKMLLCKTNPISPGMLYLQDPDTGSIQDHGKRSLGANPAVAPLLDGRFLFVAGLIGAKNSRILFDEVEVYNPENGKCNKLACKMSMKRWRAQATPMKSGLVLLSGGVKREVRKYIPLALVEIFDPRNESIHPVDPVSKPRDGHTATCLPDGRVIIAGGTLNGGEWDNIEIFDPEKQSFRLGCRLKARTHHSATLLKNGWILFAGGEGVTKGPLPDLTLYNPKDDAIVEVGALAVARHCHSATLLKDDRILIAGGLDQSNQATLEAELIDPSTLKAATQPF